MDLDKLWLLLLLAAVSFVLSFVGSAVGLVLGHMRLPLLIAYLGSAPVGAACNLLVSATGALAGASRHLRDGRVSWRVLMLMGAPSLIGAAVAAALFAQHVSAFWSHTVIGVMLIVSAVTLVRPGAKTEPAEPAGPTPVVREVVIGLGLGALAAITGLMLGSLRLPMMLKYLRIDPKVAVGTNMVIGCVTGLVGAATTFLTATQVPWGEILRAFLYLAPPTVLGGYLGAWWTGRLSPASVKRLAGVIIGLTGVFMLSEGAVRQFLRPGPISVPEVLDDEPVDYEEPLPGALLLDIDDD